jgi:hypothetical protein
LPRLVLAGKARCCIGVGRHPQRKLSCCWHSLSTWGARRAPTQHSPPSWHVTPRPKCWLPLGHTHAITHGTVNTSPARDTSAACQLSARASGTCLQRVQPGAAGRVVGTPRAGAATQGWGRKLLPRIQQTTSWHSGGGTYSKTMIGSVSTVQASDLPRVKPGLTRADHIASIARGYQKAN